MPAPAHGKRQRRRAQDRPLRQLAPHVLPSNVVAPEDADVLAVLDRDGVQVREDEVCHVPHLAVDRQRDDVNGGPGWRVCRGAGARLRDEAADGTGGERPPAGPAERAEEPGTAATDRAAVPGLATVVEVFAGPLPAARYHGGCASLLHRPHHFRHLRDGLYLVRILPVLVVGARPDINDVVAVILRPRVGVLGRGVNLVFVRVIDAAGLVEIHFGTHSSDHPFKRIDPTLSQAASTLGKRRTWAVVVSGYPRATSFPPSRRVG